MNILRLVTVHGDDLLTVHVMRGFDACGKGAELLYHFRLILHRHNRTQFIKGWFFDPLQTFSAHAVKHFLERGEIRIHKTQGFIDIQFFSLFDFLFQNRLLFGFQLQGEIHLGGVFQ